MQSVSLNQWPDNYRQINMDWDISIFRTTILLLGALHLTQAFSQGKIWIIIDNSMVEVIINS